MTTTLSYILTVSGVVPMMVARLPFAMPAPIAAWMSTNWSIAAGLLVIGNFLITLAIYYPFFKVFEKTAISQRSRGASERASRSHSDRWRHRRTTIIEKKEENKS